MMFSQLFQTGAVNCRFSATRFTSGNRNSPVKQFCCRHFSTYQPPKMTWKRKAIAMIKRIDYKYPNLLVILAGSLGGCAFIVIPVYHVFWKFRLTPEEYALRQQIRFDLVSKRMTTGEGLVVPFTEYDDTYKDYRKKVKLSEIRKTLKEDLNEEYEYDGGKCME